MREEEKGKKEMKNLAEIAKVIFPFRSNFALILMIVIKGQTTDSNMSSL